MSTSPIDDLFETSARGAAMRAHFRGELRGARAAVLANAEGFEAIAFVLEQFGRYLTPKGNGLGAYRADLVEVVKRSATRHARAFERGLFVLCQSRNDHMHVGAHARDAALIGMELALILEEALSLGWKDLTLGDLMTENVVTVDSWETLDRVRHLMLRHAFTIIPTYVGSTWYLISDRWIAGRIAGKPAEERRRILGQKIEEVIGTEGPPKAYLHSPDDLLGGGVKDCLDQGMVLVGVAAEGRLLGILSPADVL